MKLVFDLLTSRLGLVAIVAALLIGWHFYDRQTAVLKAVDGYVLETELTAEKAARAVLELRLSLAQRANDNLEAARQQAEKDRFLTEMEIRSYAENTEISSDCTLSSDLLERLQ